MKVWKTIQVVGSLEKLAEGLNAIEQKMQGTVIAIMPWDRHWEDRGTFRSEPAWDVVYYVEGAMAWVERNEA